MPSGVAMAPWPVSTLSGITMAACTVAQGALKLLRMRTSAVAARATRARAKRVTRMAALRFMASLLPFRCEAGGRMPQGIDGRNEDVKRGVHGRLWYLKTIPFD